MLLHATIRRTHRPQVKYSLPSYPFSSGYPGRVFYKAKSANKPIASPPTQPTVEAPAVTVGGGKELLLLLLKATLEEATMLTTLLVAATEQPTGGGV